MIYVTSQEECGSPCACDETESEAVTQGKYSLVPWGKGGNSQEHFKHIVIHVSLSVPPSSSPAVLKYLGDAGLLGDVSALVAKARAQDEESMRKIENRASGKTLLYPVSVISDKVPCRAWMLK